MAKSSPRIPKYRKHKPSGQAVVTLNGHDHYLGPHGTEVSKNEYDRLIAEWLATGRTGRRSDAAVTIDQLTLVYWKHVQGYYEPRTAGGMKVALRGFRRLYGPQEACEIGPIALKAFRQELIGEELSRVTINKYVSVIKSMIRWGVEEELLPADRLPAIGALRGLAAGRSAARETDPVSPVLDHEVEAVMPFLPQVVQDMIRVQRYTGMRPAEVCGMTPGQLDTTGRVWTYSPAKHKNTHRGKERDIAIGPKAQTILKRRLHTRIHEALFPAQRRGRHQDYRATRDRPAVGGYTTAAYRRAIARACEAAGVPGWSPNQLRHTRATEIRQSHGLDAAGAVLGHTKIETTQVYAERSRVLADEIALASG